ncbi:hypothetical protein M3172_24570 [Mesobacillus subterraneus]|uniref:hypothetical protein n=1 Tax=Mesobacillus subterraneus TaxID=285983 RepID=UPI00203BF602|nr:hypothetical protein [Mesobacillus subterraneus]MCM3576345.1 hypothetical protein [Mesobacillus subterraneus]
MKLRLLLTLLLISVVTGCNTTTTTEAEDFIYSFEMNSIEEEDQNEVQRWLNNPDLTPISTYEIHDEVNGRYLYYAHSSKFSEVEVTQKGDAIKMMFRNEKTNSSDQDAFVKIKFNPDIIKNFVLDSEETE